jgi:hypothetical protein
VLEFLKKDEKIYVSLVLEKDNFVTFEGRFSKDQAKEFYLYCKKFFGGKA